MSEQKNTEPDRRLQVALKEIRKALEGLQYGNILVVVQDGIVVQIDKTTRNRIDYSALDKVAGGEGI